MTGTGILACLGVAAGALVAAAALAENAPPAPATLDCTCVHTGEVTVVHVTPTVDPYRVEAIPIGTRFLFKAVWTSGPDDEAAISLYTYHPTKDGPLPLTELKFRPPWPTAPTGTRYGFTGLQTVYEPSVAGDLQFWCAWVRP